MRISRVEVKLGAKLISTIGQLCMLAAVLISGGVQAKEHPSATPSTHQTGGKQSTKTMPMQSPSLNSTSIKSTSRKITSTKSEYVGATTCKSCHEAQYNNWHGSHHDLAMQEVTPSTVMGDFNNATFNYFGTTSTFFKKEGQYTVTTDGPDGKLTDYPIAYTFGVYPLQQYLIEFPDGRLQALNVVWDSRTKAEGGQRWFHLYPDEHISHKDELHWTGINQNWNFMCADCHSTGLQKQYDFASNNYDTRWQEIDVACEACHGPGADHLSWAQAGGDSNTNNGIKTEYNTGFEKTWAIQADTGNAAKQSQQESDTHNSEVEHCAQCHSRRATRIEAPATDDAQRDYYNRFHPALLTETLYHADGQIDGEVFVYGSFLQSKMYHAGVTCSNCHEPHSLELRLPGNAVCSQCHATQKYDAPSHHLHPIQSEGAQCVNCHMPAKNFMVIDARRDHSFRIPRPDLSERLGTPNACIHCHQDKSNAWAADALRKAGKTIEAPHYANALSAARSGHPSAASKLAKLIADSDQPSIVRATAVSQMPHYLTPNNASLLQSIAYDDDHLLRLGLAGALQDIPEDIRAVFAVPLLYDEVREVRALAGKALVGVSLSQFPVETRDRFERAMEEYMASEWFNSDRPESRANLASVYRAYGEPNRAIELYKSASDMAPFFIPAYVNLADLYRSLGREQDAEKTLRLALQHVNEKSDIYHALGLSLVRQGKTAEALSNLKSAMEGGTNPHHAYVYAIALNSEGATAEAVTVLETALALHPANQQLLGALVSIANDNGDSAKAEFYWQKLQQLNQ